MAYIVADRVKETTIVTGTGPATLAGAASGYRSFASQLSIGDTCAYAIVNANASEWEVGIGTYSAVNTLTRTTIQASTNSNAAVVFSAGTKDVFMGPTANTVLSNVTSNDGTVTLAKTGSIVDLSVAVAAATTNVIVQVRNNTGATLTKGTVVYINNAIGQIPTVAKALATSDATSAQTLGMISADLANNSNGYVTIIGLISNINTSAYVDGDQLYLSGTTAGTFTKVKPYAPTHLVYVGIVEHAHVTQGKIFVKVQNGYEMDELHNVDAYNPSNGDLLIYNTSTNLWTHSPQSNLTVATSQITGTLPVANGGTGSTTASGARTNLGLVIGTDVLAPNGSAASLTNFPTLNQNTTGTAANVTGIVAVVNGGTGVTTSTGTGSVVLSNTPTLVTPQTNAINAVPVVSGAGNDLALTAGSGVGTGAGGNVVIVPGTQATSGGDGIVLLDGLNAGKGKKGDIYSVVFGYEALSSLTGAYSANTAIGYRALKVTTTGNQNVAIGNNALLALTTGYSNTAVGDYANASITTSNNTVAIGESAGAGTRSVSVGAFAFGAYIPTNSVAIGCEAGRYTTGTSNVLIGNTAGFIYGPSGTALTSGIENTLIGNLVDIGLGNATASNCIVLGSKAFGRGSNTTTIGNSSTTATYIAGSINPLPLPTAQAVTAATGNGTTVTYTCANTFSVGQTVSITGLTTTTGSSLNLANQTITTASATQFTITNATVGTAAATQAGTATIQSAGNSVTITAGNGSGAGAGGSIILQPGTQGSSGGNGSIQTSGLLTVFNTVSSTQNTNTTARFFVIDSSSNYSISEWNGAAVTRWFITPRSYLDGQGGNVGLGGEIQWGSSDVTAPISTKVLRIGRATLGVASVNAQSTGGSISYPATTTNYPNPITPTLKSLTSNVAYITLPAGHGYTVGSNVVVALSPSDAVFDGTYVLTAVTATTISYARTNTNIGSTATSGNVTYSSNDFAASASAFQRINCTSAASLTGIAPPSGGTHVDGRMVRVYNVGAENLTLVYNSGSSTTANKFSSSTGADIVLSTHQYVELIYDTTDNGRGGAGWRVSSVH